MELSRFHRAIEQISDDYSINGIESDLSSLSATLASISANPGNPSISQSFKDQINIFRAKLSDSPLNEADGELLDLIISHNLEGFIGSGLFDSIKKILDDNQLTPNLASIEIEKFRSAVAAKMGIITTINKAFTDLQVDYYRLDDGESEMLVDLPMESETKTLEDLAKEVKDWHQICRSISETFDLQQDPVTIRSIGSGSILLYLAAAPAFIYGVAKCLKGVNLILSEVIKMKDLYQKLVEANVPNDVLTGMEKHNEGKAKTDLDNLASSLVDEYYKGNDMGRKNELKISLSISLQRLSQKLVSGAKVNLRLLPPKKPKIENGEEPTQEQSELLNKIDKYNNVQIEINESKATLDYKAHAKEISSALPAPAIEAEENIG